MREARVISWDRFKEHAFDLRTDLRPANRTVRAVFVDQLLDENRRTGVFTRLVPARARAHPDGFRLHLTRCIPALPWRARIAAAGLVDRSLEPLFADLTVLEDRYLGFLEEHGLFEPAWLERSPAYRGGDYLLIMPDLAEDFPEFEPVIVAAGTPFVRVPEAALPELRRYGDSRTELEATLGEIAMLLDSGVDPASIVLTVGDLESLRPRLEQAAELVEIPLSVRQGIPLARSAPGRMIAMLPEVVASGFSVESVKRLLGNRAIPWASRDAAARLVPLGAGVGAMGGTPRPDPRWRRMRPGPERELIDLLIREIPPLVNARSAGELRTRFTIFMDRLTDATGWEPETEARYQRCRVVLRELADLESAGITIDAPFRFWTDRLAEELYVPRSAGRGVAVLPYRVGAGLAPAHHFVMNATNVATRVAFERLPFLTEAERDRLSEASSGRPSAALVEERDLTAPFLRAYAASGGTVVFSASSTTWDGPALPPGPFVAAGRVVEPPPPVSPFDAWRREEELDAGPPSRVYRLQQSGAAAYAQGAIEGAAAGRVDLTRSPLTDPALVSAALARQRNSTRPELVSLSGTHVEAFRTCPFSYLLTRVLGVEDVAYGVDPDDARQAGDLYHKTLEAFFAGLHAVGAAFDPSRLGEYRARLRELYVELGRTWVGMIPDLVLRAREPLADRVFAALLESDAGLIPGHTVEDVEKWEQEAGSGALLVGRIDRVTRSPEGTVTLVDYKKRRLPTHVAQHAGSTTATGVAALPAAERASEAASLESIQIPFYIRLLRAEGKAVATAGYHSLEDATTKVVVGEDGARSVMSWERMEEILVLLDDVIVDVLGRLESGDYRCGECDACIFRGVCRTKFVVR